MSLKKDLLNELANMDKILHELDRARVMSKQAFLKDKNLNLKLMGAYRDFLNYFNKVSEHLTEIKMKEEGYVHGQIYDILAYFGIISREERERMQKISNESEIRSGEPLYTTIQRDFSFFQSLIDKLRNKIEQDF